MSVRWITGVLLAGFGIGVWVACSTAFAARHSKPKEIVVVGSKIKKSGGNVRAGDILIHRWQKNSLH